MNWIVWATVGYFLNALAVAIDKALLRRREMGNPAVYTLLISCLGLLVLVLAPFGLEWPTIKVLALGLGSGVCFTLGLWLMFMVLQKGEASRVPAFIGSLNPVFVFLGSFLLAGEHLSLGEGAAFGCLVAGGLLMVGGSGGLSRRAMGTAVASSAVFGLAYVLLKLTFGEANFISGLVWSRLGGFVAALALLLLPGTIKGLRSSAGSATGMKFAMLGGQALAAAGGLMNSFAITMASVTLVNALQGIQYVFLLALAALVSFKFPQFFRDEFSFAAVLRKASGTVLIVLGLALLGLIT